MQSVLPQLAKSIYEKMLADVPLQALVNKRHNTYIPSETVFPYIVFGEFQSNPWNSLGSQGEEVFVTFNILALYNGGLELEYIDAILKRLFANTDDLTIEGNCLFNSFFDSSDEFIDVDHEQRARHGVLIVRMLIRHGAVVV